MAVRISERLILRLHEVRKIPLFAPRPKGSLTSENWHKPYAEALMEVEPQRLSRLIVEAERAIFGRYLELCMNPRPIEISRDLQNAVYVLIDLKKSIGNPVVIYEESALTPGAADDAATAGACRMVKKLVVPAALRTNLTSSAGS